MSVHHLRHTRNTTAIIISSIVQGCLASDKKRTEADIEAMVERFAELFDLEHHYDDYSKASANAGIVAQLRMHDHFED